MRTIHKCILDSSKGLQIIELERSAVFLHAQYQRDVPTMWFEVIAQSPLVERVFLPVATGDNIGELSKGYPLRHLATFSWSGMPVVHLYGDRAVQTKYDIADSIRQARVDALIRVDDAKRKLDRAIMTDVHQDTLRTLYHDYIESLAALRNIQHPKDPFEEL